jgi:cystathionine beta-lyase family protein involved in aluminum resistance
MKSEINEATKVLSLQVKADYGARKSYDLPDFARICTAIEKGEMKR